MGWFPKLNRLTDLMASLSRLAVNMKEWKEVRKFGVPVLTWWEVLVKPGIKKLAIERSKELNKERRGSAKPTDAEANILDPEDSFGGNEVSGTT